MIDQVRAVAGVADAQAFVQGDAVVIDKDGNPIERPTAPTFGAHGQRGTVVGVANRGRPVAEWLDGGRARHAHRR